MRINVIPEVIALVGATYVVRLRGTALLAGQARGWIKQAGSWRAAQLSPGDDIRVVVRQADSQESPDTPFEVVLSWKEDRPARGPVLWRGTYRVKNAPEGPVLEEAG